MKPPGKPPADGSGGGKRQAKKASVLKAAGKAAAKTAVQEDPSLSHCLAENALLDDPVESKEDLLRALSRLAVQTGSVVLYEIEDGVRRVTKRISKRKPIEEYLKHQGRFGHMLKDPEAIAEIQKSVDLGYEATIAKMS